MKVLDLVTGLLLIVAGVYVGLQAVNFDVMSRVPVGDMAQKALLGVMGAAAVYQLLQWRGIRRRVKG